METSLREEETQGGRPTERQTEIKRQRETETEKERETERHRQRERQRHREKLTRWVDNKTNLLPKQAKEKQVENRVITRFNNEPL